MNHFFSIVISCKKAKNASVRFCGSDALFIKWFNFYNFWPKFWAHILRYFLNFRKCAYESLLQHRNILQKSEKRFCEVLRIRCTFSFVQFFIMFAPFHSGKRLFNFQHNFWRFCKFGQLFPYLAFWDIFSISGNALMNHFFSIVISCKKAKRGSVRFCGSDAPFHSMIQFFIIFGLILGPHFEIFSQFAQEMRLWITSSASWYLAWKIVKNELRFCEVLRIRCTFSLNDSIFHNFWYSFGARVWDIFSISGNALMNHFFSIVISCKKAKNASVRFCGSDAPFH